MEIFNQTYYHHQKINETNINWKVGDSLIFKSPQLNFYYQGLIREITKIQTVYNISDCLITDLEESLIEGVNNSSLQTQLDELLEKISYEPDKNKFIQYFQEIIYEYVRKRSFKFLPSRHHCIWVVPQQENLREWEEILPSLRSRTLELNLSGHLHRTSGILIDTSVNRKISIAFDNAVRYWSCELSDDQEVECLFEGAITIIREIF